MLIDVQWFVSSCTACAHTKVPRTLPAGKLMPLPAPHWPWLYLAMDFIMDLPELWMVAWSSWKSQTISQNHCTLSLCPAYTQPLPLQSCYLTMCSVILESQKISAVTKAPSSHHESGQALGRNWGVNVSTTSGYHPQTNLQMERANQEISQDLQRSAENQEDWPQFLPWTEYAQNSIWHSATWLTLFQCELDYQPHY